MKVTRILHASVNVAGRSEETRRFYADLLGLAPADRPDIEGIAGHWFGAGDGQVHLVDFPAAGEGIDPTGNHYCLAVEDISSAVEELEEAGVPYLSARQGPVLQIWVTDPSGNTVELQEDRPL